MGAYKRRVAIVGREALATFSLEQNRGAQLTIVFERRIVLSVVANGVRRPKLMQKIW